MKILNVHPLSCAMCGKVIFCSKSDIKMLTGERIKKCEPKFIAQVEFETFVFIINICLGCFVLLCCCCCPISYAPTVRQCKQNTIWCSLYFTLSFFRTKSMLRCHNIHILLFSVCLFVLTFFS